MQAESSEKLEEALDGVEDNLDAKVGHFIGTLGALATHQPDPICFLCAFSPSRLSPILR